MGKNIFLLVRFPIRERDRFSGMGVVDSTHPFSVPVVINLIRGCYKWRRRGGAETIDDDDQPKSGKCRCESREVRHSRQ
jgi:hypothetical protein